MVTVKSFKLLILKLLQAMFILPPLVFPRGTKASHLGFSFFFIIQDVSVSQPVLCFEDWCFKPTLHGTASMESSRDRSFPGWGEFLSMEPSSVHCTLSESSAPWPLPNPCEYCHQPYNYPQVLLSRNHLLVVFYISLQHRVLRKTC